MRDQSFAWRDPPYGILAPSSDPDTQRSKPMDFTIPRHVETIAHRVRQFLDDEVIPLETELLRSGVDLNEDILQGLRAKAKAAKLWAPTMPKAWGGMGLNI